MAKIEIFLATTEAILLNEGWPAVFGRELNSPENIEAVSKHVPPNCPAAQEGKVVIRAGRKLPSTVFVDVLDKRWFHNCFRQNRRWGACNNCVLASPLGGIDPKYAVNRKS